MLSPLSILLQSSHAHAAQSSFAATKSHQLQHPKMDFSGMSIHTMAVQSPPSSSKLYMLDVSSTPTIQYGAIFPSGRIIRCDSDGQNMEEIAHNLPSVPECLAVDTQNHHIYYTNAGCDSLNDGFISRINTNGQNPTTIIPQGITRTPKQHALDLTVSPSKLYWCDRDGMRVFRSNLDGTEIEILFQAGDGRADRRNPRNWCVGLAIDTKRRVMYWTQSGPERGYQGRLLRARLDLVPGENAFNRMDGQVLFDNLPEPIQLYLNIGSNTLYMSDRGDPRFGSTITEIKLGKRPLRKIIRIKRWHEAIGMTMDDQCGKIYFSDSTGTVHSTNRDGSEAKVLLQNFGEFKGIAFVK